MYTTKQLLVIILVLYAFINVVVSLFMFEIWHDNDDYCFAIPKVLQKEDQLSKFWSNVVGVSLLIFGTLCAIPQWFYYKKHIR